MHAGSRSVGWAVARRSSRSSTFRSCAPRVEGLPTDTSRLAHPPPCARRVIVALSPCTSATRRPASRRKGRRSSGISPQTAPPMPSHNARRAPRPVSCGSRTREGSRPATASSQPHFHRIANCSPLSPRHFRPGQDTVPVEISNDSPDSASECNFRLCPWMSPLLPEPLSRSRRMTPGGGPQNSLALRVIAE
jgi:hypothetical protein